MSDVYTDEVDVRVLEETMTKVNSLTENISKSLFKLAKSSYRAERNIKPISGKTRDLQIYGTNLESSLEVISNIKDYAKLSAEHEQVIQGGPERVGVLEYSKAVTAVNQSLQEIKKTDLNSFHKVVSRMEQLVRQGNRALKDYFGSILDQAYAPIDAGVYIKNNQQMPIISSEHVETLTNIAQYFDESKQRLDSIYAEKVSNYIMKSMAPLAQTTLPKPSKNHYARGSNTIPVYTAGLKGMLESEWQNLAKLYKGNDQMRAYMFEQVCASSLAEYCGIANKLDQHVNQNMTTDGLLIFEVIECDGLLINFIQEVCKSIPSKLRETMDKNCSTAQTVFVDFIKYIDSRIMNLQQLPSDNGVCDASVDIMGKMGRMADYKQSQLTAISTMTPGAWIPKPAPSWASQLPPNNSPMMAAPFEKLSGYYCDVIDAILLGLEFKSKTSGRRNAQTGFFILTNYTVIEQYVMRKEIHHILGDTGRERLDRLKKRGLNLFLQDWKQAASYLMDVTVVKPGSDKLSSKDREIIKEKFKTFNAEFEQLVQRHKSFNLKDQNLKQMLSKEIQFISPLYHRFYDKHCGGDFSKNVDKYIKYSKEQFDDILKSLG